MHDERRSISRPTGWFCVGWSADLPAGGAPRTIHYFDTEMVIYRGGSGLVVVFEAYCAHMGAHLGVGGRISGDDIVCPYHAWRWDSNGEVAEIPYSSRTNRSRRLRQWPVRERDGAVYVWDDERGREPMWEPPRLEALARANDPASGRSAERRVDLVRMAPLMLAEALTDRGRLAYAHGTVLDAPELATEGPCLRATYAGDAQGSVTVRGWGTGIASVATPAGTLVALVTPVDKEHSELRAVMVDPPERRGGEAFTDVVKRRWSQLDQDISVWEHQRWSWAIEPEFDGPEWVVLREWAEQFHGADRVAAS